MELATKLFETIKKMNSFLEWLKEVLRLAVFSIPGFLIQVISGDSTLATGFGVPVLYALRALDKAIHDNPKINSKGLLPF